MRISIATWSRRLAGGVESYLSRLVPELIARGHAVSMLYEADEPIDREPIVTNSAVATFNTTADLHGALSRLASWKPDVIFTQGLEDPEIEARLLSMAPAVFFAHVYRGTCISGTKSFSTGGIRPCGRGLGPGCMLHFYPRRCGGLNPLTMVRLYRRESRRQRTFREYEAVVTFSGHIASEYIRHGALPTRTFTLPAPVSAPGMRSVIGTVPGAPARVLFVGRMESLKGGDVLLQALPAVHAALDRPLHLTFVGDGRCRERWRQQAAVLCSPGSGIVVDFVGWVDGDSRDRLLAETDLLVVPSLWPEPFGLIGVEAAASGVPAAAFDVGGIREWLKDGVNGYLAPASPPAATSLAAAMLKCLRDPDVHARLRRGALEVAARHTMPAHAAALLNVLSAAAARSLGNADDAA